MGSTEKKQEAKAKVSEMKKQQKRFLRTRELKTGEIYMFPRWGFVVSDEQGNRSYLDTNPFTKSLDREYFLAKELLPDGRVRGNFYRKPVKEDFYLEQEALKKRDLVEVLFLTLVCGPYFFLKNLWVLRTY